MAACDNKSSAASVGGESYIEKKYGGITPKKPLISKDHERAYFDSANWVLGKLAANKGSAIESLKPKLKDSSSSASPAQAYVRVQLSQCHKVKFSEEIQDQVLRLRFGFSAPPV